MKFIFIIIFIFFQNSIIFSEELAKGIKKIDKYKVAGQKNFLKDYKKFGIKLR